MRPAKGLIHNRSAHRDSSANKADLTKFRDMLVTARDRVQKLKSAGKSALEAVAERPFADLEPVWGKGIINGDQFVQVLYLSL